MCLEIEEFKKYSFEDFSACLALIGSRAFNIEMDGVDTKCLIPFADMLNHKYPEQTSWSFDDDKKCFIIKANEDIRKGKEVFISYENTSTDNDLFFSFGFVCDGSN